MVQVDTARPAQVTAYGGDRRTFDKRRAPSKVLVIETGVEQLWPICTAM